MSAFGSRIFSTWTLKGQILSIVVSGVLLVLVSLMLQFFIISKQVGSETHLMIADVSYSNRIGKISIIFKLEVQAWKNLLLRGTDPESNKKHSDEIESASREIEMETRALEGALAVGDRALTESFLFEQKKLTSEYEAAKSEFLRNASFNAKAADDRLKGKDRQVLDSLEELTHRLSAKVDVAGQSVVQTIQNGLIHGLITSLLIAMVVLAVAWIVVGRIVAEIARISLGVADGADQVDRAAAQIAAASAQLSSSATEQAAAMQETSASTAQTSAMISMNADNAKKSTEIASASQAGAMNGKAAIQEVIQAIEQIAGGNVEIMTQIEESNREISEIVKLIAEIGGKTKVINDIVFQTKLLSFNASVEAARAGEHGKGFAVVAEEVGNLAQMSGNAAKEISEMLDDSIRKVEAIVGNTQSKVERLVALSREKVQAGTQTTERCREVLDGIVNNVTQVGNIVSEISTASQEQSRGVEEVTKAMNQLEQVSHQNNSASQQAAQAATDLHHQVNDLRAMVNQLNRTVHGAGT